MEGRSHATTSRGPRRVVANVAVLLVAVLASMLLVGCSGGDDRLTRAQLVRRADAICTAANRQIARMARPDPDDTAATGAALGAATRRLRTALVRLRALDPPEADAADYERWLTQIGLALDRAEASSRAIAGSDIAAADAANHRGEQIRADADRFAVRYGMRDCARS